MLVFLLHQSHLLFYDLLVVYWQKDIFSGFFFDLILLKQGNKATESNGG